MIYFLLHFYWVCNVVVSITSLLVLKIDEMMLLTTTTSASASARAMAFELVIHLGFSLVMCWNEGDIWSEGDITSPFARYVLCKALPVIVVALLVAMCIIHRHLKKGKGTSATKQQQ